MTNLLLILAATPAQHRFCERFCPCECPEPEVRVEHRVVPWGIEHVLIEQPCFNRRCVATNLQTWWRQCSDDLRGPGYVVEEVNTAPWRCDRDGDGDMDLRDWAIMQRSQ